MSIIDYGWDKHFEREWNERYAYSASLGLVTGETCCSPMQPGLVTWFFGCWKIDSGKYPDG